MNGLIKIALIVALAFGLSTLFSKAKNPLLAETETIHVYGANWCPQTKKLRKRLDEKGIPYAFHNIDDKKVVSNLMPRLTGDGFKKNGNFLIPIVEDYNGNLKVTTKVDDYYQQAVQRGIVQ